MFFFFMFFSSIRVFFFGIKTSNSETSCTSYTSQNITGNF
ncbi:hypothetical protein BDE02_08G200000 [Populus trichocarpa]|nr:hypothetical protein BDE02_08G200000 [Populus trichocarpa]